MAELSSPLRRHLRSAVLLGGGLLREAVGGIREGLELLQAPPAPMRPATTLEQELEQARRDGRWLSEEERLELEQAARQQQSRQLAAQQRRRMTLLTLLGCLVLPPLWPLAAALGAHLLFPLTTRRLIVVLLVLVGLATLAVVALLVTLLVLWL